MATWVLIIFLTDGTMEIVVPSPKEPNGYSSESKCQKALLYAQKKVKDLAFAQCTKVER